MGASAMFVVRRSSLVVSDARPTTNDQLRTPSPPLLRRRLRRFLSLGALDALREGLPLAEDLDVLARGEGVELQQRQRVVERIAVDEAELRAAGARRLREAPQRLQ